MENMIGEFCGMLDTLPAETERSYETLMTRIARKCTSFEWEQTMLHMIATDHAAAYEAFFVLCTIYRRNKDFRKLSDLLRRNYRFSDHPSYNHLVIMYHVHSGSFYDYDELLELAYSDALEFCDNAGYQHTFANSFATICENCDSDDRQMIVRRWYRSALRAIDKALELEPKYAKFYCTKGRILAANEEYPKALSLLQEAISLEDSSRPDYALTISNYQYHRLLITTSRQYSGLSKRLQMLESRLSGLYAVVEQRSDQSVPVAYEGADGYAFVSYAHLDKDSVYPIINNMNSVGKHVWYDEGIRPGEEWAEVLGRKIEGCSAFVLMLTDRSINSLNVRKEVNLAISMGKPIIGIFIEEVVLTVGMRLQLEMTQMIKKHDLPQAEFLLKLQQLPM